MGKIGLIDADKLERWYMHGETFLTSIKLYPWSSNKYFSICFNYDNLYHPENKIYFHDEGRWRDEEISATDYEFGFIYGQENKSSRHFFSEWYVGIGMTHENKCNTIYGDAIGTSNYYTPPKIVRHIGFVPTFYLGYNIGIKTVR